MATEKRLIDAIAYCKMLREEMDYLLELDKTKGYQTLKERMGLEVAIADLGDMPTVDAVEVVRCKDCKHYVWDEFDGCHVCMQLSKYVKTDFWCAYGERKDND